ncbi:MAG: insulinase family protein [Oscillospiraceae bacterium]|nr:insulinase family protein [Oscillospiraceae bacterium]
MNNIFKRVELKDGIYFNSIIEKKFKTNRISINIITKLDEKTVSKNSIIPFILEKGYKGYDSFKEFSIMLDNMYGTSFSSDVRKIGDYQILNLSISAIDDEYCLEKDSLLKSITDIILNIMLIPNFTNGEFKKDILDLEKTNLIQLIESELNDKRTFCINKLEEHMYKEKPSSINKYGKIEDIKKLTEKDITDQYKKLLKSSRIEVFFTGCGESSICENIIKDRISKLERIEKNFDLEINLLKSNENITENQDVFDVNQCKMAIGFSTDISPDNHRIYALKLGVTLYGGMPFSKLFKHVRERLSLCYYCSSRMDKINGGILVDCGVEKNNIEKTKKEILNQLEVMKLGDFTEDDLNNAKLAIINGYKSFSDSLSMIELWNISQLFSKTSNTPEEECNYINNVEKKDVVEAMKTLRLNSIYTILS